MWCACVHPQPCHIQPLARSFDQAPSATQRTPSRRHLALCPRAAIGPEHHLPAIALIAGIGFNGGTCAHVHRLRMGHSRVAALVSATDQDPSTACTARSLNVGIKQAHLMTGDQDVARLLSWPCTHVQRAAQAHRTCAHAAQQHDGALSVFHRLRLHHARVVHRIGQQIACRLGTHEHLATIGLQQATIAQQGIGHTLVDAHAQQLIAQQVQGHVLSSHHGHVAARGQHCALVVHLGPQQGHIATAGRLQGTLIHQLGRGGTHKAVAPRHEVSIADVQCRGDQAPHIHRSTRPKQNAVRVDQKHLAIGRQTSQNR